MLKFDLAKTRVFQDSLHRVVETYRQGGAVSWNAENYVKCTGSRNRGEAFKILAKKDDRYETVSG